MFNEDRNAGRGLEVIVGLLTTFISLIIVSLIIMLVTNAQLSIAAGVGGLLLCIVLYWFTQLSYRLLFNKPKQKGGLLSPVVIKFWCAIFGFSSLVGCVFAVVSTEFNLLVTCVLTFGSCIVGWQVATKRQRKV